MYYFEWLSWKAKLAPESDRENDAKIDKELGLENTVIYESETLKDQASSKLCASSTPKSRGPVYAYNESFIEIRSGVFETHRGYLTIASSGILVFIINMTFGLCEILIDRLHAPPRSAQAGFDYGIPAFLFYYLWI